jgi:hypothetical protein
MYIKSLKVGYFIQMKFSCVQVFAYISDKFKLFLRKIVYEIFAKDNSL